jgi:heptosyltransferase II
MNIAVFWPNWIGDAVMATPAVRALQQYHAPARIVSVLKPYIAGVLQGSPWLEDPIFLDTRGPARQRWLEASASLRRAKIDLAILFANTFRSALVAWAGKCRERIGYRRYGRSFLLTEALEPQRDAYGCLRPSPIIDAYNRLAAQAGCPRPSYRMELSTTGEDEAVADSVWNKAGFMKHDVVVCFNPGAAFGSAKYWPANSFVELAQRLVDERGYHVLILCGPSERSLAADIAARARRKAVYSLAEHPLSLGLSKACVRRAALLVTTDSGPRHFAAAFARPVVTLFGPTHIAWTETYYPRAVHLQRKVDCGPCQRRVCPFDHRCMNLLTPEKVLAAVDALMARSAPTVTPLPLSAAG